MSYPVLCGAVVLTSGNNAIRFTEGATTATTTIPAGTYYLRGGYTTNLITQSEDLSTWSTGSISVSAQAGFSPQGTTAYLLANTTGGTSLGISRSVSFTGTGQKIVSAYLKSADLGTSYLTDFDLYDATAIIDRAIVRVSWSAAGVPTLSVAAGNATLFPVVNLGNGWYRVAFAVLGVIATNSNLLLLYPAGVPAARGQVYAWGVQAENARNLNPSGNNLGDTSFWGTYGATVSSSATAAPDGTTGNNIDVNSPTAGFNFIAAGNLFSENGTKSFAFYARANTASQSAVSLYDSTLGGIERTRVSITWSGGVPSVSVSAGSGTVSAASVGSGWYLITATSPNIVASSDNLIRIYPAGYTAATGSTLFWGVQAYNPIVPGLYVPTTGASATGPSDELSLAVKTALEAATASTNTYDVTVSRNISPSAAHTRTTITRLTGSDAFGVLWADALTTFDERLLGFSGSDVVSSTPKQSVHACAANWAGNDVPREMEPVSERIVSVPRAASGRVQGVSRSARMQSWRMGLAFIDERRMLVDRALSVPGDTLEGFLERFGANAALEAWEAFIDTGTGLLPLSLANLWSVMHFSEDTLSGFTPTRLGPGVPLYSIDLRLHSKV